MRHKLMLVHGVVIALVPWLLDSSDLLYGRRSRPIPGQDRRGEPVRPVVRRPAQPARSPARSGTDVPRKRQEPEKTSTGKASTAKTPAAKTPAAKPPGQRR